MSQTDVRLQQKGSALWATLDGPDRGNACGSLVMAGLGRWLDLAASDDDVRCLVLTGAGSTFCAGADLKEAGSLADDTDSLLAFLERGRDLVAAIRRAPVPVIAAVNGAAYAGGLELVMACDLAVAADDARLGDRHIAQGQIPGWGSSALLPPLVGRAAAARLLLTGESWSAEEAARRGLVSEVVPADALVPRVDALAETLAAHDQQAVRRMLALARPVEASDVAADREWHLVQQHASSVAARERAATFGKSTTCS